VLLGVCVGTDHETAARQIPALARVLYGQTARASQHRFHDDAGILGLRGAAVPLLAQIIAIVDVFDAVTTARPIVRHETSLRLARN